MGIPGGWKVRRVWRLTVLVSTFLVLVYFGLDEVHGDMASWLVILGAVARLSCMRKGLAGAEGRLRDDVEEVKALRARPRAELLFIEDWCEVFQSP